MCRGTHHSTILQSVSKETEIFIFTNVRNVILANVHTFQMYSSLLLYIIGHSLTWKLSPQTVGNLFMQKLHVILCISFWTFSLWYLWILRLQYVLYLKLRCSATYCSYPSVGSPRIRWLSANVRPITRNRMK